VACGSRFPRPHQTIASSLGQAASALAVNFAYATRHVNHHPKFTCMGLEAAFRNNFTFDADTDVLQRDGCVLCRFAEKVIPLLAQHNIWVLGLKRRPSGSPARRRCEGAQMPALPDEPADLRHHADAIRWRFRSRRSTWRGKPPSANGRGAHGTRAGCERDRRDCNDSVKFEWSGSVHSTRESHRTVLAAVRTIIRDRVLRRHRIECG